jgi:hypothetical protein
MAMRTFNPIITFDVIEYNGVINMDNRSDLALLALLELFLAH